jgi:amidase
MDGETICWMPARAMAAAIATGRLTATAVLEAHLDRIAKVNPMVNAIVTLDADGARALARAADAAVAGGAPLGPLHGLPIAVKDLEDTAGMRTTYGARAFADHVPGADGLLAERLRAAGAIVIGKTNTPELGAGSQTFNAVFGATRNPFDLDLTPGGSSGGAAVAVACGMVPLADGSDLGASVRNPAAFCSVVGLRPSPGAIPDSGGAEGGDPWESLSVLGPIARDVDDAALLYGALAGANPRDPRSVPAPPGAGGPVGDGPAPDALRIAWSRDLGGLPVERPVLDVLDAARERLVAAGARVADAEPDLRAADEAFDVLRAVGFATTVAPLVEQCPGKWKSTVVANAEKGLALTGAQVASALRARARTFHAMRDFLAHGGSGGAGFDVLALPVSQVAPFSVEVPYPTSIAGVEMEDYIAWMRSCSRITVTGHPAIAVPAGFTAGGLPIGLQLVGRHRGERDLLGVARAVERALGAARRPPLAVGARDQDRNNP